jgi:DHA2 family multidrug resistance protein-like MFS transporter
MLHPPWIQRFEQSADEDENTSYPLRWFGLAVICASLFIGQVDVTIVNVALPSIATDLGASTSDLQWIMDAYSVALAGFVLLGGGLADRYGRKGVFILGMAVYGVASLVAVFATEPWHLIACRGVMGLGAAMFFPPALSILAVIFAEAERPRAVSIWAAVGGLATVLGPVIGGLLLGEFWWGSVFLVAVPVTVAAIVGAVLLVPTSHRPGTPPLDVVGAVLSVIGLAGLVFGLIEGPNYGWTSAIVLGSLLIGAAAVVLFIRWELRTSAPMFDLRVFRIPGVTGGGLAITVNLLAMTGMLFLLPQFLQYVTGESTVTVGLALIPFGLTFMILAMRSGAAVDRFGVRPVLVLGLVVMGFGSVVLAFVPDVDSTILMVLVGTTIFGAGAAFVAPPGTTAVMNSLPTEKAGDGSAVNQITRQVGAAFGVAIVGTILAATYATDIAPSLAGMSESDAAAASASIGGAQMVAADMTSGDDQLIAAADAAFSAGYQRGLLVPAGLILVTAAVVALTLRPARRNAAHDEM